MSDLEKRLLAKGLNYALPPIKLNYGDYMTPFELFYREIRKLPIEDHELEKVKTEIKKEAYSSFDNYNFWNELNISKDEFLALKGLSSNKDINLLKHEDKLIEFLKRVKSSVTTDLYKHLYPQDSQPGIMYGLFKTHKPLVNGFPKLRPILCSFAQLIYF